MRPCSSFQSPGEGRNKAGPVDPGVVQLELFAVWVALFESRKTELGTSSGEQPGSLCLGSLTATMPQGLGAPPLWMQLFIRRLLGGLKEACVQGGWALPGNKLITMPQ